MNIFANKKMMPIVLMVLLLLIADAYVFRVHAADESQLNKQTANLIKDFLADKAKYQKYVESYMDRRKELLKEENIFIGKLNKEQLKAYRNCSRCIMSDDSNLNECAHLYDKLMALLNESQAQYCQTIMGEMTELLNEAVLIESARVELEKRQQAIYRLPSKGDIEWFDQGIQFLHAHKYKEAIEAFTKALEINPKYVEAYYKRGLAFYEKGDNNRAIADFTKALDIKPTYANAYCYRASAWGRKGEIDRSIADYSRALDIVPRDADAYVQRGSALALKGNLDNAIDDFNKALGINPNYARAYYNRGLAWSMKQNLSCAINDFTKTLDLNPQYANAYYYRAVVWNIKGNTQKALADAKKAYNLRPKIQEYRELMNVLEAKVRDTRQ